jgi:protoheme IX farnesyltransferase
MPILMGSLAATEKVSLIGWAFFGVLFFWQFPHFMAIAWKYREQYRAGGMQMLTVTDPTGRAAGMKSVVTATLLIVVSLLPVIFAGGWVQVCLLVAATSVLGWYYLAASWRFLKNQNDQTARKMMLVSLMYLPLYMMALVTAVCL